MSLTMLANPFLFTSQEVRTAVDENNMAWFCAKDVCSILDIQWTGHTLDNMPERWKGMLRFTTPSSENGTGGGDQNMVVIKESGLYRLIFRSNKPAAIDFTDWVCETVLPQIHRTGKFGDLDIKAEILLDKRIDELSQQLVTTKNAFRHQLLTERLQRICTIAQQPVPNLALINQSIDQTVLPGFNRLSLVPNPGDEGHD